MVGEKEAYVGFGAAPPERREGTAPSFWEAFAPEGVVGRREEDESSGSLLRWERGGDMCESQGGSYVFRRRRATC